MPSTATYSKHNTTPSPEERIGTLERAVDKLLALNQLGIDEDGEIIRVQQADPPFTGDTLY